LRPDDGTPQIGHSSAREDHSRVCEALV